MVFIKEKENSMSGTKTECSTNNVLYVILTLKNHSDRNNALTTVQITNYLNNDFGTNLNRTTVGRILEGLRHDDLLTSFRSDDITEISSTQDIKDPFNLGFYLGCRETKKSRFYYFESTLLESELITLFDTMETFNYLSVEDIRNLSLKLSSLRPLSKKNLSYASYSADKKLKEDESVLQYVSELTRIINNNNLAIINYGMYVADGSKPALVKMSGYPKTMRPLRLIWNQGYYYCVMGISDQPNTVNLRIDRITGLEEKEADEKELRRYSGQRTNDVDHLYESRSDYCSKHPTMQDGELQYFSLLVNIGSPDILGDLVDLFGKNIRIDGHADKKLLAKYHLSQKPEISKENVPAQNPDTDKEKTAPQKSGVGKEKAASQIISIGKENATSQIISIGREKAHSRIISIGKENTASQKTDTGKEIAHSQPPTENWVKISDIKCTPGGMEQFAIRHCANVIILSPAESAEVVKEALKKGISHY